MRKTCVFWSPNQVSLFESEYQRLKTLHALYPQLIICEQIPIKFNPSEEYIRITNSQSSPIFHMNLISTIVYCLKLDNFKKNQLLNKYKNANTNVKLIKQPSIHITNNFSELIQLVIKQLGYEQSNLQKQQKVKWQEQQEEGTQKKQTRFELEKQLQYDIKNSGQIVLQSQFFSFSNIKQACKSFKIQGKDVEKMDVKVLASQLEKQLKLYLKNRGIEPIERQFNKLKQSKTLIQLCQSCLHFYTLEKYLLYQNLNMILRNFKSIAFKQQFEKLKLFAFLLILNYLFVYSGEFELFNNDLPQQLFRYTDIVVDPEFTGQIITVPSFYSVSARQKISSFNKKQTKIIIHPLVEGKFSVSVNSLYPIHKFSAFQQEDEYLYLPFTCFLVTQVRYKKTDKKWIVHLKQVPGNLIIQKIFDLNLLNANQQLSIKNINNKINLISEYKIRQIFAAEWQLKCQQRYEFVGDREVRIKVSFNLGLIFLRLLQKYELAINYFNQGVELTKQYAKKYHMLGGKMAISCMLVRGYNYLGLAQLKLNNLSKSDEMFSLAEKQMQELSNMDLSSKSNQKNSYLANDHFRYLNAAMKNNRASWLQSMQKYQQSIIKYKQALIVLDQCLVKNQLMQSCLFNNIGACLAHCKNISNECQFQYLYKSFVKYLHVYGIVYAACEEKMKCQERKDYYQKQLYNLARYVKQLPIKISQIISILQNCSQIYQTRDKLTQAIQYQQAAIQIYKRLKLVEEKQSITLMYMKARLAKLFESATKYQQSIAIYQELLVVVRMVDDSSKKLTMFKCNIAACYANMGSDEDLKLAFQWYSEAINDISSPLLTQNLELYNKICDYRKTIAEYLQITNRVNKNEKLSKF